MSKTELLDRRDVVKLAAAGTLLAASGSYIVVVQQAFGDDAEDKPAEGGSAEAGAAADGQVGFLVKPHNCINCQACVEACRKFNKIPKEEPSWRKVTKYAKEDQSVFVSTSCMHCAEPACATVCPAGAITKGEAGIVSVNPDRCIGCKLCYSKCPQKCIDISRKPVVIQQEHCLHCGNCMEVCPARAVERRESI